MNPIVVAHPLLSQSLTILRDKNTEVDAFREHTQIVSRFVIEKASENLSSSSLQIETPLVTFTGSHITTPLVAVPVLRAGLSMLPTFLDLFPDASVGMVGQERDEKTAIASQYYGKLPNITSSHQIFILDPMLATGGSARSTIAEVKKAGGKIITLCTVVCAPEGIEHITQSHPDVTIVTAAIDSHLDERKYIVPGLGDFGDRYFGTQ